MKTKSPTKINVALDGNSLTFDTLIQIACDTKQQYSVSIKASALPKIHASRKYVESIVETALEMGLETYENLLNRERDLISPF